jgi:hypothetical protein
VDEAQKQALRVAEFEKLRDEVTQRISHQVQILSLMLTGVVGLLGVAFSSRDYLLVLIIPSLSGGIGLLYVAWQFGIARIGEYLREIEPDDGWSTSSRPSWAGRPSAKGTSTRPPSRSCCWSPPSRPGSSSPASPSPTGSPCRPSAGSESGSTRSSRWRSRRW